jgi:hypothetical protein
MGNEKPAGEGAPQDAHAQDEIMERQRQRGEAVKHEPNPLDEAVAESFPASDPPAATARPGRRQHGAEKPKGSDNPKTGG